MPTVFAMLTGTAALTLHSGPMEEPDAHVFVNFANANFGYGRHGTHMPCGIQLRTMRIMMYRDRMIVIG
jgi:hypothetical protein